MTSMPRRPRSANDTVTGAFACMPATMAEMTLAISDMRLSAEAAGGNTGFELVAPKRSADRSTVVFAVVRSANSELRAVGAVKQYPRPLTLAMYLAPPSPSLSALRKAAI